MKRKKVYKRPAPRIVMARKRRFTRVRKAYRSYRRHKLGSGILGEVAAGGVLGAGIAFGTPTINSFIPKVGPLNPTTVAVLGGGLIAKGMLHKGGKWSSAAVVLGSAMAAHDLMAGMGGTSTGGLTYY